MAVLATGAGLGGLPAAFSLAGALAAGVPRRVLAGWVEQGLVERLGQGVYARADLAAGADPDLLEAAVRAPAATVCLVSALARHGLTDEVPGWVDLALPGPARRPVGPACARWHRYAPATFAAGREVIAVAPGVGVGLYGPQRTLVDVFNPRLRVPEEVAVAALRAWLPSPGATPAGLLELAGAWPAARARLLRALRVLL